MLADRLRKAWEARRKSTPIEGVMRFSDEGLVLGAGTVLAPSAGSDRDISIDPLEPRLQALLAAAHLRPAAEQALGHLRRATECWRNGDDALTAMHLVLSRLDRLQQPNADAHRLFLADGLLRAGVGADSIIAAIELGAVELERLQRYDAEQPRVPAGSGRTSGQWTVDGGGTAPGPNSAVSLGQGDNHPKADSHRQTAPSAQGEVNSSTVMPVADHILSADTGVRAMLDCIHNLYEEQGSSDNDNLWVKGIAGCRTAKAYYDFVESAVETNPNVLGGIVGYPDGGRIIVRKGKADIYLPAHIRRSSPLKRSNRP